MMEMQIQTKTDAAKRQRSDLKYHKVVPIRRSAKKQSTDVFSDRGQYERIQLAAYFGHTKHVWLCATIVRIINAGPKARSSRVQEGGKSGGQYYEDGGFQTGQSRAFR